MTRPTRRPDPARPCEIRARAVGGRLGASPVYRGVLGRHFPAMAVVQVVSLVEPEALVEIEATAVIG